jgi:large subunit ribosomal protein L21
MYAVIATGGKQVRVQVGDVVKVERLEGNVGDSVVFDQILMVGEGESTRLGKPTLEDAKVLGTLVDQDRHAKIIIYKSKRRQNSNRRRAGHRQDFTAVKIDAIEA